MICLLAYERIKYQLYYFVDIKGSKYYSSNFVDMLTLKDYKIKRDVQLLKLLSFLVRMPTHELEVSAFLPHQQLHGIDEDFLLCCN